MDYVVVLYSNENSTFIPILLLPLIWYSDHWWEMGTLVKEKPDELTSLWPLKDGEIKQDHQNHKYGIVLLCYKLLAFKLGLIQIIQIIVV